MDRTTFLKVAVALMTGAAAVGSFAATPILDLSQRYLPSPLALLLVAALLLLPLFPAMIRRLHDTGRPGASVKWCLGLLAFGILAFSGLGICDQNAVCSSSPIFLVVGLLAVYVLSGFVITGPVVLFLVGLFACLLPSQPGPNRYGPKLQRPSND